MGADGRGAGSISGCHVAGSRTSMTYRGHAKAGRQRNGATRLGARQGAACLLGAMNVSAGVQRPVLDGARRNAGRRILGDDVTVAPVADATPPIYSAASASVFSRSSTVFGIDAADQPGPFTGADAASRFQRRSSAAPALF
jgi:hypothetical protein